LLNIENWLTYLQREKLHAVAAPVQSPGAHHIFRSPEGVHASAESCQNRGAFLGPLIIYYDSLETAATRDGGLVTLPGYVYPDSEAVLQSATAVYVRPGECDDAPEVTVEPGIRRTMDLCPV
jgi:hypothetical protein